MNLERAREFMRAHHRAVLATTRSDGRPQLSPVTVGVDDGGRVLISTRETAMLSLQKDPEPEAESETETKTDTRSKSKSDKAA